MSEDRVDLRRPPAPSRRPAVRARSTASMRTPSSGSLHERTRTLLPQPLASLDLERRASITASTRTRGVERIVVRLRVEQRRLQQERPPVRVRVHAEGEGGGVAHAGRPRRRRAADEQAGSVTKSLVGHPGQPAEGAIADASAARNAAHVVPCGELGPRGTARPSRPERSSSRRAAPRPRARGFGRRIPSSSSIPSVVDDVRRPGPRRSSCSRRTGTSDAERAGRIDASLTGSVSGSGCRAVAPSAA